MPSDHPVVVRRGGVRMTASSLRELFDAALELAPAARTAFLDERCLDRAKRRRLERMLAAADADGEPLLETPAARLAAAIGEDDIESRWTPGGTIGPWTLVDRLGEGGSATVFRAARDLDGVRQEVAIKLLRRGTYSPDTLRMFRRERQSLAALSHPNIAHLIDGGTTNGDVPYLVMEYVDGVPITQYAATHALGLRKRLALMATVCDAVEAAHRSLIVHRDLKPSNILVTGAGEVKLLDFGIAKLLDEDMTDDAGATRTGCAALTPAYAAPEQFSGEAISTATDVYALGVVLHELLLGERPGRPLQRPSSRARGTATGGEARTLHHTLRGDLDNILMKALAEEPARRYARAGDLADDIERHLAARPVAAHPPSLWYRARKFVQRHRGGVAGSAAFVIALLAAFALALWQTAAARHESRRANAMRDFIVTAFGQAAPAAPREGPPRITDVVREAIAKARADASMEPGVRTELLMLLGGLLREQGALDEAIVALGSAAAQAREQAGADAVLTQDVELELLRAEVDAQGTADARAHADRLLAQIPHTRDALRAAVLVQSSTIAIRQRDYARAGDDARQALDLARAQSDAHLLGDALGASSEAQYYGGDLRAAAATSEELLALRRAQFGAQHWHVAAAHANLSRIYRRLGDLDAAERHARAALAIDDAVLKPDDWRRAQHLNALLMVHRARDDYEAALAVARETLRVDSIAQGEDNPTTLNDLANVGFLLLSLERPAAALPVLREASAGYRRRFGAHYHYAARTRAGAGMAQGLSGDVDAGLAEVQAAIADYEAMEKPDYDGLAEACEKLARLALARDRIAAGLPMPDCIDRALAQLERPDAYWIGRADLLRAEFALRQRDPRSALAQLDHAGAVTTAARADAVLKAEWPLLRARALHALGDDAAAEPYLADGRRRLAAIRYPPARLRNLAAAARAGPS